MKEPKSRRWINRRFSGFQRIECGWKKWASGPTAVQGGVIGERKYLFASIGVHSRLFDSFFVAFVSFCERSVFEKWDMPEDVPPRGLVEEVGVRADRRPGLGDR